MLYLATSVSETTFPYYANGTFGLLNTPASSYSLDRFGNNLVWAADNGCFSSKWQADKWLRFLEAGRRHLTSCLWAVVPDVVGDHAATVKRFEQFAPIVRELGYRLAFVGQDGATVAGTPWEQFDCWFAGGSTHWKLHESWPLFHEAKKRNLLTHMGRVNSFKRFRLARDAGYDSADGTFLAFGPDTNLPRLLGWLRDSQLCLL
jgi:hypothetical protein